MTKIVDASFRPPNEAEHGFEIGKEVVILERQMGLISSVGLGTLTGNEALKTLAESVSTLLYARKESLIQSLDNDPPHS